MSDFHRDSFSGEASDDSRESTPFARDSEAPSAFAGTRERSKPSVDARFDLASFVTWLPRLGAVLWLDRPARRSYPRAMIASRGVLLLDHPALQSLARCDSASAHRQVTSHGPREWIAFHDMGGEPSAKLFLLPDTDYLAWDEMIDATGLAPSLVEEAARWYPQAACLRSLFLRLGAPWQAQALTFEHRRMPWLQALDARPPLRLSLLGHELALAIARNEGAELSPSRIP